MTMAQFRATIQGQRGEASRLGTKNSGLRVTANGWDCGIAVQVSHEHGKDVFRVWRTSGSNGGHSPLLLAEFTEGHTP